MQASSRPTDSHICSYCRVCVWGYACVDESEIFLMQVNVMQIYRHGPIIILGDCQALPLSRQPQALWVVVPYTWCGGWFSYIQVWNSRDPELWKSGLLHTNNLYTPNELSSCSWLIFHHFLLSEWEFVSMWMCISVCVCVLIKLSLVVTASLW